jgi:hypothetical protein
MPAPASIRERPQPRNVGSSGQARPLTSQKESPIPAMTRPSQKITENRMERLLAVKACGQKVHTVGGQQQSAGPGIRQGRSSELF